MSDLSQNFIASLFKLSRALRKFTGYKGSTHDLTITQIQTLTFVSEEGSPTVSQISKEFKIALPTATGMLEILVNAGYLQRVQDSKDRRVKRIKITGKGKRILVKTTEKRAVYFRKLVSLLPKEDIESCQRIISDLLRKVEEPQR